jgi:hypothetical protein
VDKKALPSLSLLVLLLFYQYKSTNTDAEAAGKVDKKALPSLASIREKQGSNCDNMPATPAEVKVAQVFAKVMNLC